MKQLKFGVNTFGLGPLLYADPDQVWSDLKNAGVDVVEPLLYYNEPDSPDYLAARDRGIYGGCFPMEGAADLLANLRAHGLEVHSFQFHAVPCTLENLTAAIPFMLENGVQYAVYSFLDRSVAGIQKLAPTMRAAIKAFRAEGLELLMHNHDAEWYPDGDTSVMEWLFENLPELHYELDMGWAEYAHVSCVSIMKRYGDRIPLLHFKEIMPGAIAWQGTPFCVAPGKGILPMKELMETAKAMDLVEYAWIIDQDDSANGDIIGDITEGIACIRSCF